MPRILRSSLPDGPYHVTARGVDGTPIFLEDDDRRFFLELLSRVVRIYHWDVQAFCLMDNHFHVVLETRSAQLSAGMQRLNGTYASTFNERHGRTGHLFGGRFWSSVIDSDEHLRAACVYVVANPVRAGLCATAEEWRWTASRDRLELA